MTSVVHDDDVIPRMQIRSLLQLYHDAGDAEGGCGWSPYQRYPGALGETADQELNYKGVAGLVLSI